MELEFVNVELDAKEEEGVNDEEEFAFPLFGGAQTQEVVTVSLKEPEDEQVYTGRPDSYYRAVYTEGEKQCFIEAAVTTEEIFTFPIIDSHPWKVMSVEAHNSAVEREKQQNRKRRRPGKKKRESVIVCRERRLAREKEVKKEQKTMREKYKRKLYKKPTKAKPKVEKPKYRTE